MEQLKFKKFRYVFRSHHEALQEAAEYATAIGRENVVSISHSESIVTVWYWTKKSAGS